MNEVTFVAAAPIAEDSRAVDGPADAVTTAGALPGPRPGEASSDRETAALPALSFVRPLPGFGHLTHFALVRLDHAEDAPDAGDGPAGVGDDPGALSDGDPAGLLFELRSLQAPDVRFLVAAAAAFFPDYEIELDEEAVGDLALRDAADALVLVVLTVGDDAASTTANLLAPVVVNARNRSAAQIILSGTDWPVRATVA